MVEKNLIDRIYGGLDTGSFGIVENGVGNYLILLKNKEKSKDFTGRILAYNVKRSNTVSGFEGHLVSGPALIYSLNNCLGDLTSLNHTYSAQCFFDKKGDWNSNLMMSKNYDLIRSTLELEGLNS